MDRVCLWCDEGPAFEVPDLIDCERNAAYLCKKCKKANDEANAAAKERLEHCDKCFDRSQPKTYVMQGGNEYNLCSDCYDLWYRCVPIHLDQFIRESQEDSNIRAAKVRRERGISLWKKKS